MNVQETIAEFLHAQEREKRLNAIAEAVWQRSKARANDGAAIPSVPTRAAFDAMWARSTPLHQCSDGVFRNPTQLAAWVADRHDNAGRLRQQLQAKHCAGGCSTVPGHLCSCKL